MATMTENKGGGTVTESPLKIEPIEWVTPDEALKYTRMLFKNYVKLGKDGKPVAESKDYFYKIISAHPFVPGNVITSPSQNLIKFEVQKFHRNKHVKKKVRDGGTEFEEEANAPVDWVMTDALGNTTVLDAEANQMIEAREFLKRFAPDTI